MYDTSRNTDERVKIRGKQILRMCHDILKCLSALRFSKWRVGKGMADTQSIAINKRLQPKLPISTLSTRVIPIAISRLHSDATILLEN